MKIIEYVTAAQRTFKDLDSLEKNNIHMILGMNDEISELFEAKDNVNFKEELGDYFWFFINFGRINNLYCPQFFNAKEHEIDNDLKEQYIILLNKETGKLTRFLKKEIAYNKPMELEELQRTYLRVFDMYSNFSKYFNLEHILTLNIQKLYTRYPEKFSEDKALIRDLETERKVLEA